MPSSFCGITYYKCACLSASQHLGDIADVLNLGAILASLFGRIWDLNYLGPFQTLP